MRKLTKNEIIELRACKDMDDGRMEFFKRARKFYEDDPDAPCYGDCNHCSVAEHCDDCDADDDSDDEADPFECEGCEYVKYWLEHHRTADHPSTK